MKLGKVIGRVTLNAQVASLRGGRWLIVTPLSRAMIERIGELSERELGTAPSLIMYDDLGAGTGDIVGYIEGREAAMPFDQPTPIDAICAAIIDKVELFRE